MTYNHLLIQPESFYITHYEYIPIYDPNNPDMEGFSTSSLSSTTLIIIIVIAVVVVIIIIAIIIYLIYRSSKKKQEETTKEYNSELEQIEIQESNTEEPETIFIQEKRAYVVGYGKKQDEILPVMNDVDNSEVRAHVVGLRQPVIKRQNRTMVV